MLNKRYWVSIKKNPLFVHNMPPSFNVLILSQAVYIAPLKALVRERMDDWRVRFEEKLGRRYEVADLTSC